MKRAGYKLFCMLLVFILEREVRGALEFVFGYLCLVKLQMDFLFAYFVVMFSAVNPNVFC